MLVNKITHGAIALSKAVKEAYAEGQADYTLAPIVLTNAQGEPVGRIQNGDAVIFCCRRGEREVELTEAFTEPGFDRFPRPDLQDLRFVILTLYHEKFKDLPVAFAPTHLRNTLTEVVSRAGLTQLHTAESEKFAHVTFFFNGGNNRPFAGEDDLRIPSPRGIPFDLVPELSLPQVTEEVLKGIEQNCDLIVTNFANGDVIGHTSSEDAKIKCASIVDTHLGRVVDAALANDYVIFVTADHGNLEEMRNADGTSHVAHTINPVKFVCLDSRLPQGLTLRDGKLADVAPTVLSAMGLGQPAEMTGDSLASSHDWGGKRRVLLLILDGWGIGEENDANPIFLASTPRWDDLIRHWPNSQLDASGEAVGLKAGKTGNSEAGHMNLGAGRVVMQDDVRLDMAMQDGTFYTNEIFLKMIREVKQNGRALHLLGLLSEKSSHGSIDYPLALLRMAKDHELEQVHLHLIFDGRSTEPGSAPDLLEKLEGQMEAIGIGDIVTAVGRGIALDRDGNYAKIQRAFDALVFGKGRHYKIDCRRGSEF
jgi:2,3-bisphosphoglycerate-independent phosphoglycerate mutase